MALTEELARFHAGAHEIQNMQQAHRAKRVQHIANLQQRMRDLEFHLVRQEQEVKVLHDKNKTAQLLIAHYTAEEDEEAELERRGTSRLMRDRQRTEEEIDALRVRLVDDTKKYELMLRDCNASVKNLAEAEKGARRQGEELAARDATIA